MGSEPGTGLARPPVSDGDGPAWTSLVDRAATAGQRRRLPSVGQVVGRFVVVNLLAVAALFVGSVWVSRTAATDEVIADARRATELLAELLVEPALQNGLPSGDPVAVTAMDEAVRGRLEDASFTHVKIWTADERIVYSDDPSVIGLRTPMSADHRRSLADGLTRATVSDLDRPENRFDRSSGRLLEVYKRVETPSGEPLLLETHSTYRAVTARQTDVWLAFAPISMTALLALVAVQLPLARWMVVRLRAEQHEREALQARVLDATSEERRRLAGSLHDGVVQDVSASALLVAGAADQLRDTSGRRSPQEVADSLAEAATALRGTAGSLRSLLVEIYPPNLQRAGLGPALEDLASRLRPRGIDVRVEVPDDLEVPLEVATLLFRVAQESLLNVAKHAGAHLVEVRVTPSGGSVVLDVSDDGVGFDLGTTLDSPGSGHLGLSMLCDLAEAGGAGLEVRTAPGAGTQLRMEVPLP
ncbi:MULTISPECIES: sensor histidine kinase [unclassified Blastococcus]